jgi:hypothetical protein
MCPCVCPCVLKSKLLNMHLSHFLAQLLKSKPQSKEEDADSEESDVAVAADAIPSIVTVRARYPNRCQSVFLCVHKWVLRRRSIT